MILLHGDCLELMKTIPDKSVDLVLTDIPYGELNQLTNGGLRNLDKADADNITMDLNLFLKEIDRLCKGSIYVFCGYGQLSPILSFLKENEYSIRPIVLKKSNPSPMNGEYIWLSAIELCAFGKKSGATFNERCKPNFFNHLCEKNDLHPTQKPLSLFERLIRASSNKGDTVLDPCMGSGTAGVAAKRLDRKFIGIELNEEYFNIAKKRIETEIVQEYFEFLEIVP